MTLNSHKKMIKVISSYRLKSGVSNGGKKKQSKCKNIIVKDYIYPSNYIFGTFYEIRKNKEGKEEIFYILDDGDVYSEKSLKYSGYKYIFLESEDIIKAFKKRFNEVKLRSSSHD